MVYCRIQPEITSLGREKTIWKSSRLMVRPIPNIAVPRKRAVYCGIHMNSCGWVKAIAEVIKITTAMYLDNDPLTLPMMFKTLFCSFILNCLLTCMLPWGSHAVNCLEQKQLHGYCTTKRRKNKALAGLQQVRHLHLQLVCNAEYQVHAWARAAMLNFA